MVPSPAPEGGVWFTRGMSQGVVGDVDRLSLKFDGPDVEDNSIDVRDLAPSLLALADLYAVAHRMVGDGLTEPPALDVKANGEGSFLVDLLLYFKEAGDAGADLLAGRGVTAVVNGATLVAHRVAARPRAVPAFRGRRRFTL